MASANDAPTRIEVYQDAARGFRWRMIAAENGQIIADSAEGYASVSGARLATERLVDRMRATIDVVYPATPPATTKPQTIRHEPYLLETVVESRVRAALAAATEITKSRGTGRSTNRRRRAKTARSRR